MELQEISEKKDGLQFFLKSQEDAIGLVQQSIQDEKDEISEIENRMAARKQKFQEECLDIRARKEEVEMRIKDVTNKGVMDKRHMSSGNI